MKIINRLFNKVDASTHESLRDQYMLLWNQNLTLKADVELSRFRKSSNDMMSALDLMCIANRDEKVKKLIEENIILADEVNNLRLKLDKERS